MEIVEFHKNKKFSVIIHEEICVVPLSSLIWAYSSGSLEDKRFGKKSNTVVV